MLLDKILLTCTDEEAQIVYKNRIMFSVTMRSEQDILALKSPKLVKQSSKNEKEKKSYIITNLQRLDTLSNE